MSTFIKDLLERCVRTFIAAALGAFVIPAATDANLAAWKSAVIVAVVTGITAVMALLTKNVGPSDNTASIIEHPVGS